MNYKYILFLFATFFTFLVVKSQQTFDPARFASDGQIGIYEHLDETIPSDIILIDQDSTLVNLKSLIDKPTVLSFVYFNCPGLCSPLLDGLAEVIDRSELELGKDFQVITISFNPTDGPTLSKKKKSNYVQQIHKPVDARQWMWFTADSANIAKATATMGFRFLKDGKEYAHAAAIMVLSPKGKITRYLHGTYFLPFDLKMAITEAREERSGPTISKVLKFCFSYDAKGKKYVFNITKVTGSVVLSSAIILFLVLALKPRRKNKSDNQTV